MRQSMSRAGSCYDNAFMESCFGTIKTELELESYESGRRSPGDRQLHPLLQPCFIMPLSSIWPKTRGIVVQGQVLWGCLFAVLLDEQRTGHGMFPVVDG